MIRAHQIGNHLDELLHIVAQPTRTELPEVREVLAQLRRLNPSRPRQRLAAHCVNPIRQ